MGKGNDANPMHKFNRKQKAKEKKKQQEKKKTAKTVKEQAPEPEPESVRLATREELQEALTQKKAKTIEELEKEAIASNPNPEDSVWYHPIYNPFGAAPQGEQQQFRKGTKSHQLQLAAESQTHDDPSKAQKKKKANQQKAQFLLTYGMVPLPDEDDDDDDEAGSDYDPFAEVKPDEQTGEKTDQDAEKKREQNDDDDELPPPTEVDDDDELPPPIEVDEDEPNEPVAIEQPKKERPPPPEGFPLPWVKIRKIEIPETQDTPTNQNQPTTENTLEKDAQSPNQNQSKLETQKIESNQSQSKLETQKIESNQNQSKLETQKIESNQNQSELSNHGHLDSQKPQNTPKTQNTPSGKQGLLETPPPLLSLAPNLPVPPNKWINPNTTNNPSANASPALALGPKSGALLETPKFFPPPNFENQKVATFWNFQNEEDEEVDLATIPLPTGSPPRPTEPKPVFGKSSVLIQPPPGIIPSLENNNISRPHF